MVRLSFIAVALVLLTPLTTYAAATLSVQSVTPSSTVSPGTQVSFALLPAGFGGVVAYDVTDSFKGSSVSNANFNGTNVFSWVPMESDSGIHNLTIVGKDLVGNSVYVYQQLTVTGQPTLSVQAVTTTRVGQTVTISASGFKLSNPTYTLTDLFPTSSIQAAATSTTGTFYWKPKSQDVGTHTLTISARDPDGASASVVQTVSVLPEAYLEVHSLSNTTVQPGTPLTFTVVPIGFTSPNFSVTDSVVSSSITSTAVSANGSFYWVPTAKDVGVHTITVYGSDLQGHIADNIVRVTVTAATLPLPGNPTPTVTLPRYQFNYALALGSRGTDVTELQKRLGAEGVYAGPITGYFGPLTATGVRAYQARMGLEQVGSVGPKTRATLNR